VVRWAAKAELASLRQGGMPRYDWITGEFTVGVGRGTGVGPTIAGTRPGASTYWLDNLTSFHVDQATAVLGQVDNTCGIAAVQIEALRRGKSVAELQKEMIQALIRDGGSITGLRPDQVYEFLQKAGLDPHRPQIRRTVQQLQATLQSGDSAIAVIAKGQGIQITRHYVVVEGFTEIYVTGGYRIPMVQIIDSNEGARLLVTLEEFAERFASGQGQVIIVPR